MSEPVLSFAEKITSSSPPPLNVSAVVDAGQSIDGGARGRLIFAKAGDDTVDARGGDDTILLGAGHDRADGGSGADTIVDDDGERDHIEQATATTRSSRPAISAQPT